MIARTDDPVRSMETLLADRLGPQRFNVWFRNATRFSFTGNFLHVRTPNPSVGDWIERHFADDIRQAAQDVTGTECSLAFSIDPELAKTLGKKQPDRQVEFMVTNPERVAREHRRGTGPTVAPVLKGRLDGFVVGESNRLAFAAAQEVVSKPGLVFNPLFIHGGCGLGKTHLLQAICNGAAELNPQLRWRFVTGEEFTNDYVCAVKVHEEDAFRARYRNLDLLVIDDVHFFANKRATQAEFLHTFQAIEAAGRQLVLASDAHPRMIGNFSESLITRFLSGMVVRVDSPDVAVRAEVLRRRAARMKVDISDTVIQYIAENFRSNIRELEGALLKVVAQAQVSQQPISRTLTERAIADLIRQNAPVVKLSDIETVVAIFFGLSPVDLHTSRKSRTIALARSIAMYLARKHTDMSFPEIGRFMGNKNHSTVILASRRISKSLQANETVRWSTPAGEREQNLATLISDLEDQFAGSRVTTLPSALAPAPAPTLPAAPALLAS